MADDTRTPDTTRRVWLTPADLKYLDLNDVVEYDFDSYGPPITGCQCERGEPCRCARYDGLHVTAVNANKVAALLLGVPDDDPITEPWRDQAVYDLDLDDVNSYDPDTVGDYYGQSVSIGFASPARVRNWTQDLRAKHPDLIADRYRVRPYLADRGAQLTGDTLADLKAHLRAENAGVVSALVEDTTRYETTLLHLHEIDPEDPQRLARATATPAVNVHPATPVFDGVVVADRRRFVLVDGYRRHQGLLDRARNGGRLGGRYVVLRPPGRRR